MEFKRELADFKEKIDREIETFLDRKIFEVAQRDEWVAQGMEYVKKLVLSGGKRIRPALVYWGYKSYGGKEDEKIMRAAVCIELVHIFLLMHDDIIDRSDRRHGIETMNVWAERKSKEIFEEKDSKRFGDSMAMIFGDLTYAWAVESIIEAGLDEKNTLKAISYLQEIVSTTIIGESQDVVIEYVDEASEDEILEMCKNKTAKYTFEGPLKLGGILAGADENSLETFEKYGVPIGIAFQIQDDILGIFGSEEKMGKSAASDIEEGKKTILTARVMSKGNIFHKEKLQEILGKKNLKAEEINQFQEVVMDSGALKYAKEKAEEFAKQGKEEIEKAQISEEGKEFLKSLADYIIDREL